jgi:hypothetical protein
LVTLKPKKLSTFWGDYPRDLGDAKKEFTPIAECPEDFGDD